MKTIKRLYRFLIFASAIFFIVSGIPLFVLFIAMWSAAGEGGWDTKLTLIGGLGPFLLILPTGLFLFLIIRLRNKMKNKKDSS